MHLRFWAAAAMFGLLLLAGCGDSDEVTSIADALDADDGTSAELSGFVVRVRDETRLCDALAESYPPQCAGDRILVIGLDESTLDMQSEGDVAWTDETVTLTGTIQNGALDVED